MAVEAKAAQLFTKTGVNEDDKVTMSLDEDRKLIEVL